MTNPDELAPAASPMLTANPACDPPLHANRADHRDLVASYRNEVDRFISSRVRDPDEADDLVQQTLQQAIQKLDSFHGGNLRAWLLCIARHAIISRSRVLNRVQFVRFEDLEFQPSEPALQTAADRIQQTCDARSRIQFCLACMAKHLRMTEEVAILLADVHGFSDRESSPRLRMTLASFKFLLHRARLRLHGAAARAHPFNPCSLVSKTGALKACSSVAHDSTPTLCNRGDGRPSGLGEAALTALRRELVDALDIDGQVETGPDTGQRTPSVDPDSVRNIDGVSHPLPDASGISFEEAPALSLLATYCTQEQID